MKNSRPREALTVLTDPIPTTYDHYQERVKGAIRPLLRKIDGKPSLQRPKYGGHYAVTRSLIEGLKKAGIPLVYNPRKINDCTGQVVVLAGLKTLEQAIGLKKQGIIKRLAAGPNLVTFPSENPALVASEYIDRFIVNSSWVKGLYEADMPELNSKLVVWPAGVDEEEWKPGNGTRDPRSLLFYVKHAEPQLLEDCRRFAEEAGFTVTLLNYGGYTPREYKSLLDSNVAMVYFMEQESQGIALAEAWAMDVPTIVWNRGYYPWKGQNLPASSAPYLTERTGVFFETPAELKIVLSNISAGHYHFGARQWVLEHMTDKKVAEDLIQLIGYA